MKLKIILLMFLTGLSVFSEEVTELQKVDQRLEELKTIWKQDTAIINQLTNFKRTPVQEGTQAYYKCVEASKRIQQAEAEAKTLKERRASIVTAGSTAPAGHSPSSDQPSEVKADLKLRQFDFDAVKGKSESKKGKTLIFKGFYLGMPGEDALGLLNH